MKNRDLVEPLILEECDANDLISNNYHTFPLTAYAYSALRLYKLDKDGPYLLNFK